VQYVWYIKKISNLKESASPCKMSLKLYLICLKCKKKFSNIKRLRDDHAILQLLNVSTLWNHKING
jgi:predicted transcriptional regulator